MTRKTTKKSEPRMGNKHSGDRDKGGTWRKKRADAGVRAREIRSRFKSQGRRFSDSTDLVREDRDAG